MSEYHLPTRSEDGLASLDIFYTEFNDVNFYFEDENQDNLYLFIVKKLFPDMKVTQVFPLRGKPSILAHYQDAANDAIKNRIYILDRDFDHFLGNESRFPGVFYWDRFCIESHLLETEAVVEVVIETCPKLNRDDVKTTLGVDAVINKSQQDLYKLFGLFLLVQKHNIDLKNTSENVERFCLNDHLWQIDETSVDDYCQSVKARMLNKEIPVSLDFPYDDETAIVLLESDPQVAISGKYILKMVYHLTKERFAMGAVTFYSFCYRVAKNCSFQSLKSLADGVLTHLYLQPAQL